MVPLFFLHVIERVWLVVADVSFHTTMVLTQRVRMSKKYEVVTCFHTTMVLTQLVEDVKRSLKDDSFHTTMVLTQQLLLQKLYRIGGGEVKSIEFLC